MVAMTSPALTGRPAFKPSRMAAEMRIEREDIEAFNAMMHDDVIAVIGKRRFGIDVHHGTIGGCHDRVGGFVVFVPLETANIEALVHLPALTADATEAAAFPWLADGADKEPLLGIRFKQRTVGGRKLERLLGEGGKCQQTKKENPEAKARRFIQRRNFLCASVSSCLCVKSYHLSFDSFFFAILFRPITIWSASSRDASGVNWISPSDMTLPNCGAASQRLSFPFSPNWLKIA